MKIESFEDDLFNLKGFSERLTGVIETEKHFVENGLVVALTAPYGSGKSTFQKMWAKELTESGYSIINLNAWMDDYSGEPLFTIVSALLDKTSKLKVKPSIKKAVAKAASKFGRMTRELTNQIVAQHTGIDAKEVMRAGEESSSIEHNGFELSIARSRAMAELKEAISKLLDDSKNSIIFLVDELDRCRPDYAISYLEVIKHVFDVPDSVFVLSVDIEQLENSARAAFGLNLNFDEYLRKFVHRRVALPLPEKFAYERMITAYSKTFMELKDVRTTALKISEGFVTRISEVVFCLGLTPRQVQEVFRLLSHIFSSNSKGEIIEKWPFAQVTILILVLNIKHAKIFDSIQEKPMQLKEALTIIPLFAEVDNYSWWLNFLISANAVSVKDDLDLEAKLAELIANDDEQQVWKLEYGIQGNSRAWGTHRLELNMLYKAKKKLILLERWVS